MPGSTRSCYGYCRTDGHGSASTPRTGDPSASPRPSELSGNRHHGAHADYEDEEEARVASGPEMLEDALHPNCLALRATWGPFLEWLGRRWWGSVELEVIEAELYHPKTSIGDAVIAACCGHSRGGVCSVMVMSKRGVLTFDVVVLGGRYACPVRLQDTYSDPIDLVRRLNSELGQIRFLAKPKRLPRPFDSKCLSVTHLLKEVDFAKGLLKGAWWGGQHRTSEAHSRRCEDVVRLLQERGETSRIPAAVIHYADQDSPGYLFEVVTSEEKRFEVGFDKRGFITRTSKHFLDLTSLLSHLCMRENLAYVSRACFTA